MPAPLTTADRLLRAARALFEREGAEAVSMRRVAAKAGVTPRSFTREELERRYVAAMVNEGAKVVAEGIALRPLDVDVTLVHGYGFPRYKGGPMKYADLVGLPQILADIQAFAKEDPLFWQPAPLLVQLVAEGKNFDSLNQA